MIAMPEQEAMPLIKLARLIEKAREVAAEYYAVTGKPLGITGEIGEYEAARLMNLKLVAARTPGYDAIGADGRRVQIKTRMFSPDGRLGGQRVGRIKVESEFDSVMLVMLGADYRPWVIWEASREAVISALLAPGSRSRNERGALSVTKFKSLAVQVWNPENV